MKKECNVVMLATEKVSNIVQLLSDTISYTTTENIPGGKYQYLYITSDEEIEKPCWYINNNKDTVYFIKDNFKSANEDWNKIIATTDISLIKECIHLPCKKHPEGLFKSLPQIPQSFIDTFIEEYNKGNVIDKVLVEYEEGKIEHPLLEPFPNNLSYADELGHWNRFKINFDNTINISLIEKEKYSGDKLYSIMQQYHEYCTWVEYITPMEWIKENLK